jgi:hypothetical protein
VYVWVINDSQAFQLYQDDEFQSMHTALITKDGEKSALFTGVIEAHLFQGALILVDMNAPGVWTSGETDYLSSRGTVNYGNDNPLANPIMASDRKVALVLGASAVMGGHAQSLAFEKEDWDYKSKKSEASYTIVGYNRSDIYDHDGFHGTSGNFLENTSSLSITTFSPNVPTW